MIQKHKKMTHSTLTGYNVHLATHTLQWCKANNYQSGNTRESKWYCEICAPVHDGSTFNEAIQQNI